MSVETFIERCYSIQSKKGIGGIVNVKITIERIFQLLNNSSGVV